MGIIKYDQDTSHLHNEEGDFIGKIYREGDGLGPLIEERVNGWLAMSNERDQLRDHVRILREALEGWMKPIEHPAEAYTPVTRDLIIQSVSALEATKGDI